jgi:hypothetical protein
MRMVQISGSGSGARSAQRVTQEFKTLNRVGNWRGILQARRVPGKGFELRFKRGTSWLVASGINAIMVSRLQEVELAALKLWEDGHGLAVCKGLNPKHLEAYKKNLKYKSRPKLRDTQWTDQHLALARRPELLRKVHENGDLSFVLSSLDYAYTQKGRAQDLNQIDLYYGLATVFGRMLGRCGIHVSIVHCAA